MPANTPTANLPYPILADTPADIEAAVKPLALALDPLVPTAAQRQALVGGSSPPSSTNPYVTAADIGSMIVPIGGLIAYAGTDLPPIGIGGAEWDWADGGLIDVATHAAFAASVGHAYNGGVDPGGGKVRKPDKRGRVSVGADSFGLTGAANRIPNSPRARGQNGGEERHLQTAAEVAAHSHNAGTLKDPSTATGGEAAHTHGVSPGEYVPAHASGFYITSVNAGQAHAVVAVNGLTGLVNNLSTGAGSSHAHTTAEHAITGATAVSPAAAAANVLQPYEVDTYLVRVK